MSKTLAPDLRDALRDQFRDAFGERLHRLILYGSHARGDATEDSDIDLLVVLNEPPDQSDREQAHEVTHDLWETRGAYVSPLVTSRERFETYNQPLFRNVRAEGKLLVPRNDPEATEALHRHSYSLDIGPRGLKQPTEDGLSRAYEVLQSLRRVFAEVKDPNGTISSAYQAMYHAARAALNEAGKAPKSHQGVQHELRATYVQTGRLDTRYHSMLSQAEGERLDADYELTPSFSAEEAEQWIVRAEDFVDTIEAMLLDAASGNDAAS